MNSVKVEVKVLLETLRTNRQKHEEDFLVASEGYKTQVIAEMEKNLKKAKADDEFCICISLSKPESHVEDYDTVISMLEMCTETEVVIERMEFEQYVRDIWNWSQRWHIMNSGYMNAAG